MKVEYQVGISVLSRCGVCPQLLHEEHLIREVGHRAIFGRSCLSHPFGQLTDKVEEEVVLGHRDY